MYRTKQDFLADWMVAAEGTIRVLESLTDDKLDQAIVEGHSTLGWLGWHLATSPAFFAGQVGLNVTPSGGADDIPAQASEIVTAYRNIFENVKHEVEQSLTDEQMVESVDSFGKQIPRGALLRLLIDHQTHHRGQMTVLLRQAGLPVPGVLGPTKEEQSF
ncbi:DinB family protein [Ornithinibacillus salinisoli]|uniref:DinB family protein n=1 Tax=Ornithinibacillus salinisoli TaxID=1848459 RepID=A0ABW4W1P2_9BACI